MTTLEEIERMANKYAHEQGSEIFASFNSAIDLARFILRVLPVVRAADRYHRINTGQHTNGPQHMLAMKHVRAELFHAITAMREGLGK